SEDGPSISIYSLSTSRTMTAQPWDDASSMTTCAVFDFPEPTVPNIPRLRGSTDLFLLCKRNQMSSWPEIAPRTISPEKPNRLATGERKKTRSLDASDPSQST